eukprot:CAMPEP_0197188166 /NCGR_PEP_ID=MMETSP1423-20130617/17371_1 /TAXON_ID=476441 /ORGANISM="Pseudo-nitzschia heimii, Strain UNC1101" /LENGTH=85 /DNA_ID=CAMNT_0042639943 /DNA_START=847 /DNA_END=1101 /DNA_ORIENTATION=-
MSNDWIIRIWVFAVIVIKVLYNKVISSHIVVIVLIRAFDVFEGFLEFTMNAFRWPISSVELQAFEIIDGKSTGIDLKLATPVGMW